MKFLKTAWGKEPLIIVTVLGAIAAYLLDHWPAILDLLSQFNIPDFWLTLVVMLLTALAGRAFVKPDTK